MWECFSYYGMRTLLVLFMIHELHFNDSKALAIYAAYITLAEFGGVVGGFIADRFLGLKNAVAWGGWTIVLGHISLAISNSQSAFFLALGMIVVGTSLFRTNIAALLGTFYEDNDPRRDTGYTLYYAGMNIGGVLASIFCGIVGEVYGWHAGFGLAALGMLSGNIALILGKKIFANQLKTQLKEKTTVREILCSASIAKQGLKQFAFYISFLMLFYACEEQLGSTLVLFSERHINRETLFGTIPAASLVTINPLTILVVGPLIYRLLQEFTLTPTLKIAISFVLLGIAFCILNLGCILGATDDIIPLSYAVGSIFLIGVGELFIGPTVFASASKAAPRALAGLTMGMVTLGYSLANLLSGLISQLMAVTDEATSLEVYAGGFNMIGLMALSLAFILFKINQRQRVIL